MSRNNPSHIPGSFGHGELRFVCDTSFVNASLPGAVNVRYKDLADTFVGSGLLPPLRGAPVSAWVFARLALLCEHRFPYRYGEVCGSDGDDYWLEFIAFSTEGAIRPVGKLLVLGSRVDVLFHVHAAPPYSPEQLRDAFVASLLEAPAALRASCVVVVYTSLEDEDHWRHIPYMLGWDGEQFIFQDAPEHTISAEEYE